MTKREVVGLVIACLILVAMSYMPWFAPGSFFATLFFGILVSATVLGVLLSL